MKRRTRAALIALLLGAAFPAAADPAPNGGSLLFSPEQRAAILDALAARAIWEEAGGTPPPIDPPVPAAAAPRSVHLAGLLYAGPGRWTLWLNGRRVTPQDRPAELIGLTVGPSAVDLVWLDRDSGREVPMRLRPDQTYLLDGDRVVSGPPGAGSGFLRVD